MRGKTLFPFVAGSLLALGFTVSGMTQPARIIGFLDVTAVFGPWDPSLLVVLVAALLVYGVLQRSILRQRSPLFDNRFFFPAHRSLDRRLVLGAVLLGVGWGLSGYCPGSGLTSLVAGVTPCLFVVGVILGLLADRVWRSRTEDGQSGG